MTTFEHAMLGVSGGLAVGLHRRFGWPIVAFAGVAAILPDWDGLSLALGPMAFALLHRTAGHNLLVGCLLGAVAGALDYRYSLICRAVEMVGRWIRWVSSQIESPIRTVFHTGELCVWIVVGIVASLSHLAADMVFSGHATLPDWEVPLLWPFSDRGWVYSMVQWGDAGATLVFVAGMFAMVRWPNHLETVSRLTLGSVLGYIVIRGFVIG